MQNFCQANPVPTAPLVLAKKAAIDFSPPVVNKAATSSWALWPVESTSSPQGVTKAQYGCLWIYNLPPAQ